MFLMKRKFQVCLLFKKISSNLLVSLIITISNQHYNTYQILNDDLSYMHMYSKKLKTVRKQNYDKKTDGKGLLKIKIVLDQLKILFTRYDYLWPFFNCKHKKSVKYW